MSETDASEPQTMGVKDWGVKEYHLTPTSEEMDCAMEPGRFERVGKSASDTLMISKGTSHTKAVSMHMLECVGGADDNKPNQTNKLCQTLSEDNVSDIDVKDYKNSDFSFDSKEYSSGGYATKVPVNLRHRKVKVSNDEISNNEPCVTECQDTADITQRDKDLNRRESRAYHLCLIIVTMLSVLTRTYNIEIPSHVCWDETHFGKMGSWYINRTFFFDVHPPLGKMLIGLAGALTGYDGSFAFSKPGDEYGEVNYVGMRLFCGILGSLLVPLAYQIVWLLTHSILAAIFAASLILFDHGTLILSRHILLDPILMFFILLSTYTCLKFLSIRKTPFTFTWWFWMLATGISLAGAIGVKFVGLFIVLFVGYTTAVDLWNFLSDVSVPLTLLCRHIMARVACLIILPLVMYCVFFSIHFKVLNRSGSGDGFFSSGFQSQLLDNKLYNVSMPQYVAFGSVVTLKQRRTGGAYLHSHSHLYPEEHPPKQQQVTSYSHKDNNNRWLIKPADREPSLEEEIVYLTNGDLVRLEHVVTGRNLHSHKEPAPLSKHHYQVSGYGQSGQGDANDLWLVEVISEELGSRVQTVRSKIKFIHYHVRCALHSHDKKLPKWAWEQLEVTCQPNLRDSTSAWSVEEVIDARMPNVSFDVYSPTFLDMLIESHAVMTQGNSGLKPKEGEITSRPWQWPLDYRGQVFSGQNHKIYMLGNPIIFWSLLGLKALFILIWAAFTVSCKRKVAINDNLKRYCEGIFKVCWWLLLAWFLHYAPFWTMTRVLYFHHYFPAFLFSAMFGGVMLDFIITLLCVCVPSGMAIKVFHWCFLLLLMTIVFSFYLFYPMVYGMSGPMAAEEGGLMRNMKWLESWDL